MITVVKIVLGLITGSLAVIADGFHSLVDSSSNLIGLAAIRLASRPADEKYPYGYQRYESLGTLAIGGLLLVAAWEIVQSVFERIIEGAQPEISWLTFGLVVSTLPVNFGIVWLETRAGRQLNSEILLADASHTRTDLFVTASVIASLVGVWLGWPWLDYVVAIGVVSLILRASIKILRRTGGSLADGARIEPNLIESIAKTVAGVQLVHNIRSRGTADAVFVDLHVKVDPSMSTSQAHAVASEVERQICEIVPNVVDAIVHIEPANIRDTGDWEKISYGLRQIAHGMGLDFHDLHVHVNQDGDFTIELDLEIYSDVSLLTAHELADEFEKRAKNYWPNAKQIITHLEPATKKLQYLSENGDKDICHDINQYLTSIIKSKGPVSVQSITHEGYQRVFITIPMPGNIPLVESHDIVEEIKTRVMKEFPEVSKVVIHVEPLEITE